MLIELLIIPKKYAQVTFLLFTSRPKSNDHSINAKINSGPHETSRYVLSDQSDKQSKTI